MIFFAKVEINPEGSPKVRHLRNLEENKMCLIRFEMFLKKLL